MSDQTTIQRFQQNWQTYFASLESSLSTAEGDWSVKGFIDTYRNVYTITADTKVVSKLIEIMLFPQIVRFAEQHNYRLVPSNHQNHYPDITFITDDDTKIAFDLKSTYRTSTTRVNGFTLGAFTGYFRNRKLAKNITFPYGEYAVHFVFGVIYTRRDIPNDSPTVFEIDQLEAIPSVVHDFTFIFQKKWKIATDRPGSGNTKNIGSVTDIASLTNGNGIFAEYGKAVFDDYWMNYLTADMARKIDSVVPYSNLQGYLEWRKPRTK